MGQTGILCIKNRTENWKTARSFAPFFGSEVACQALARRFLRPLGVELEQGSCAQIELFWKCGRDYIHTRKVVAKKAVPSETFAEPYKRLFGGLRRQLQDFGEEMPLDINYCVDTPEGIEHLRTNISNTEIDVVLETRRHLFIGEAKDESSLRKDTRYVLVHQLIRQYVTASILLDIICRQEGIQKKQIVPFIVANEKKLANLRKNAQVEFMDRQCWLNKECNILSWDDVESLARRVSHLP